MTVAQAIQRPTASVVILAEITAGVWCRAWVVDGTYTNTYKVNIAEEIDSVKWNGTTTLTERASAALVDANAGSWYWDGATLWVRPVSGSIFDAVVQAFAIFRFSNPKSKILNDLFWDPRLLSAPNISQRIEPVFGGVGQIGGGSMTLANADGYFDGMQDYQWRAGVVTLKIGVDLADADMAWADYETLATWAIQDHARDEQTFRLQLLERKARTKAKLPQAFFNRTDYPNIDEEWIGKPVPIAYGTLYGIEPVLINPGTRQFLVAGHAIREFSAVRIESTVDEFHERTVTAWYPYSGTVWRNYLPDEEVTSVKFNGTALTHIDSLDDVLTTAGSWTSSESFTYVNPSSGQTMTSGTYSVESKNPVTAWRQVNFSSTDAANGKFIMGEDWSIGQGISVDIKGKTDSGVFMDSSIDIIEDLLTLAGETNLDSASFTTARAWLKIGTDEYGNEVHMSKVGVYLNEAEEVMETVGKVLGQIGAYLFSDATGQFSIGVFMPQPGNALPLFTDQDLLEFEEASEGDELPSEIEGRYNERTNDGWTEIINRERLSNQYLNAQPTPVIREEDIYLTTERDAQYWADRVLLLQGSPLKRYSAAIPWQAMTLQPGDQIRVKSTARGVDAVLEVLETKLDLAAKKVSLSLGNLRGYADSAGFWVADAAVLPTDFAALTGYSAGSLNWNASWDDEIKTWARQNVGYWTDANGFAGTTDPDSFMGSVWI